MHRQDLTAVPIHKCFLVMRVYRYYDIRKTQPTLLLRLLRILLLGRWLMCFQRKLPGQICEQIVDALPLEKWTRFLSLRLLFRFRYFFFIWENVKYLRIQYSFSNMTYNRAEKLGFHDLMLPIFLKTELPCIFWFSMLHYQIRILRAIFWLKSLKFNSR